MTAVFYDVLKASFQGSVVILAVMALRLVLKKAPKSLFCLLWLLAGLRLALPFEIHSSLSLQPDYEFESQNVIQIPDAGTGRDEILNNHGDILVGIQTGPQSPQEIPTLPADSWEMNQSESFGDGEEGGTVTALTFADIAAPIWLLGVVGMAAASVISYIRLKRRVRESYLIENGCFECPGLETAFVLGFLPPKIYLPTGLTDQEKAFIFDHENTHIARHDHWYKLLGYLVLSVHWFNPLVWVAYSLLCRDIELACDEHVVRYMSMKDRKAYSAALLSCGSRTARLAACPVAFGESNPKQRILNVLNYKRPGFWIILLAVIAVAFVGVCLLTSPENQTESPEEEMTWNLEMTVSDVTPSGLTVEFIQHGPFQGYDRAELRFGSEYSLEKWTGTNWEPVETLPQEHEVAWTTEAYLINRNGTTPQRIDWEWLYGELPSGRYMLGKSVDLFRGTGDSEINMFWAEFTIDESPESAESEGPAWTLDMTDEEYMAWCRRAAEEFQSREQFHITETLAYFTGDNEDSRSEVVFWRDGENWLRSSYVTRMRENRNYLYYDGIAYYQTQKESEDPVWLMLDVAASADSGGPWIWLLRWDEQNVTFEGAAQEGEELRVSVNVHSAPPTLGWDDVHEYNIIFFFDKTGTMTRAILTAQRDDIKVIDDLTMETTLASNIHSKLEAFAAQRSDAEQSQTLKAEVWLEKCREAMMTLKEAQELFLYVSSPNDPGSTANVYMRAANGWLFQYRRPQWDHEDVSWLRIGNEQYIYGGEMDEDGQMTAPYYWQTETRPESHNFQLPYPFDLDWEKIDLKHGGTVEENGMQIITVTFPDYLDEFRFSFYANGELAYFTVGDTSGEPEATTTQFLVQFPYDGTVAQRLEQIYGEAVAELNQKPEKPDGAYYAELFSRKTDGAYTEQWIHELYLSFYLDPEGFVSHLANSDRAEEILTHMEYLVEYYAPYRFDQVVSQLEQSGNVDAQLLGFLKAFTNQDVQLEQEPDELNDQIAWLAKCATALESYQGRGSWSVSTVNSFSGRDATNLSSTSVWYGIGNDYLVWTQIPDDAGTGNWWDLGTDGKTWHRYGYTLLEGSEAWEEGSEPEAWDSGWEAGSTNAQEIMPPWPVWYQWSGGDIQFGQAGVHEDTEYVVFTVQGSPYADDTARIVQYEVTFLFASSGELRNVRIRYSEEGADRQVEKNYMLNDTAQSDIRERIDQAYREATE